MPEENNITYHITSEQAETICRHFNKDIKDLEEYEICELLDRIIDSLVSSDDEVEDDLPF